MESGIVTALALTTLAGLATALGGLLGIVLKKPGPRAMSATLGFAAGVMLYISFVKLFSQAMEIGLSFAQTNIAFFVGFMGMFLIDVLTPHEYFAEHHRTGREGRLLRTGLFVALGLAIHNFPEGLATFAGTLHNVRLGLAIAVAIAVHNIPEGLAVAAPIVAATGNRKKAFLYALFSGLAEPAGALVAAVFLWPYLQGAALGWVMAVVAGLMVYVALDELVPASREYGKGHWAIVSVALGMAVMALSLHILE